MFDIIWILLMIPEKCPLSALTVFPQLLYSNIHVCCLQQSTIWREVMSQTRTSQPMRWMRNENLTWLMSICAIWKKQRSKFFDGAPRILVELPMSLTPSSIRTEPVIHSKTSPLVAENSAVQWLLPLFDYLPPYTIDRWIEACVDEELPQTTELEENLQNGVILAKLGHFFAPKVVPLRRIYDKDLTRYKVRTIKLCQRVVLGLNNNRYHRLSHIFTAIWFHIRNPSSTEWMTDESTSFQPFLTLSHCHTM